MANPDEGQVSFEASGKTWTLEITNRTERALQKRLKRPMGKIVGGLRDGDVDDLLAIFCESLKKHHPDLTDEQAIDLVRPKELRQLVGDILQTTYPTTDDDENPPQPGQDDGAGSAS